MTVSNGQLANQNTFNNAFISKTTDSTGVAKYDLNNTDPASGTNISNVQRELNKLNSFLGSTQNTAQNTTPTWTNNQVGAPSNNTVQRVDALTGAFDSTSGHDHDGVDSKQVSSLSLSNFNAYFAVYQTLTKSSVSGLSVNISAELTGETPGGGASSLGVITSGAYNRCEIRSLLAHEKFESATGELVYGRLTESSGVWTLTFKYTDSSGVEQNYFMTADIRVYYRKVFDSNTRPTLSPDIGIMDSLDLTADIVDATPTQPGKVNTSNQSFGGTKVFNGGVTFVSYIATNSFSSTQAAGDVFTLPITSSFIVLNATGALNIKGITASASRSQRFVIHNESTYTYTLFHENASAPAANRITLPGGNNVEIESKASAELIYDTSTQRWKLASSSGVGANKTLSNLTSPTALNQNLLPNDDGVKELGGTSNHFNALYLSNGVFSNLASVLYFENDTTNGDIFVACYGGGDIYFAVANGATDYLEIHGNDSVPPTLRFATAGTGGNYAGIKAPTGIGTSWTMTLPQNAGSNGQALVTDGAGVTSWQTVGGGLYQTYANENITGGGTITSLTSVARQWRRVTGSGGAQTASTTPFGVAAWADGTQITLVGQDDTNTVEIPYNDAAKGVITKSGGNVILYRFTTLNLVYDSVADRWIEV